MTAKKFTRKMIRNIHFIRVERCGTNIALKDLVEIGLIFVTSSVDYDRAPPTFSVSSFFDEWPSETTLSWGNGRESRTRTMVGGTNSGHFTHFPPLFLETPSPRSTTRSIFYRITGIVASAPTTPRSGHH